MITLEDSKLEKSVVAGVSCIAVPVEVFVPIMGDAQITTYSLCRKEAEEWECLFKGELLSCEAVKWLENKIESIVKNIGYRRMNSENEYMLEYIFKPDMHLPKISSETKVHEISSNAVLSELCSMSGCDIEIADDGEDIIFAVVESGRILAYAGMNDVYYADGSIEISVETAPDSRRKGYGAACVTALVKHLQNKGVTVRYKCSRENSASSALCEKCGFVLEGTRLSLVYEKE